MKTRTQVDVNRRQKVEIKKTLKQNIEEIEICERGHHAREEEIKPCRVEDELIFFFFSSRRRHTRFDCDWSSDVCSSDLDELIDELFVNRFLDKHTRAAQTNLSLVCERRADTASDGGIEIGVGENDVWILDRKSVV